MTKPLVSVPVPGWLCTMCGKAEVYQFTPDHWEPGVLRIERCSGQPVPVMMVERVLDE